MDPQLANNCDIGNISMLKSLGVGNGQSGDLFKKMHKDVVAHVLFCLTGSLQPQWPTIEDNDGWLEA